MSFLVALASDTPLETLPNPHMKMLSVNEALEQGIEVPKSMLMDPEIDHDEPGMIMWSDIEPNIDIEKGIFEIPDPDDNFDIWPMEEACELKSEKPFMAAVEWSRCTPGRAEMLLEYIRRHMEKAEEVELWNGYLSDESTVMSSEAKLEELTAEDVFRFCADEIADMSKQLRLVIKR